MNDFANLKPTDFLIWLSTIFAQESVDIGHVLIRLSEENIKINKANVEAQQEVLESLKAIEKSLSILIEKYNKK